MPVIKKLPKNAAKFYCEACDFECSKQSNYNNHLMTSKHNLRINGNNLEFKSYCCDFCSKIYKSAHGLWYHKKKCDKMPKMPDITDFSPETITDKQLVLELIKQNQALIFENKEFKELLVDQSNKMLELASKPSNIINTNTNCNNNNKQFNLQVFLNEKCKNAMNMSDFISSLEILDEDFENIGKLGYVQGISNIFIKGLKDLDETKRPLHCNDIKRETLYIKEDDSWIKDENKQKIRNAIALIAHKNLKYIPVWREANPSASDVTTKKNDLYMRIANQVTTAITPDDDLGINKIIRNVANKVLIDK
jgi:dsDNA-binding SOS-regulon protein